jgi:signal transduction histidine kinase
VASDDEKVVFSIIDRGRGVPKEMRSSIFEQYVQTSTADGRRGKGTGLGLSICKSIVEAHGGTIGVDSEEGSGSRFWFSVPRLDEH